jgi:hypothetical protein
MIKFGVSNAYLDGSTAYVWLIGFGIVSEVRFELRSAKWSLSKDMDWDVITFIDQKITVEDEAAIKKALKQAVSKVKLDAPEMLDRTFEDSPKEMFVEAGWRYRLQEVIKVFEIEDGLSLGYAFDDGKAVTARYKREVVDISAIREKFGQRALAEQKVAAKRALVCESVSEIPDAERIDLCIDGDWKLLQVGNDYYTIFNSRSDASQYLDRVIGMDGYVVDITTYPRLDTQSEAIERFMSIWKNSDWQSTLKGVSRDA